MDIPAPDATDSTAQKVTVTVAPPKQEQKTEASAELAPKPTPAKEAVVDTAEEKRKKIVELISSKKYNLAIKEKKPKKSITLGVSLKKSKTTKKKGTGKTKTPKKEPKKVESKNAKMVKLAIIGVLWIGFYIALDMGLVDIGWKPPFSLFGKKDGVETLSLPGVSP